MTAETVLVVIDASVVVKWFLPEDETGVAEAAELLIRHATGQIRLVAPALLAHEVFGVFVRRLPRAEVGPAIDAFCDTDIYLVPADRQLLLAASETVARHQVSGFDAAYAALAKTLDCELATADRRFVRALGTSIRVRAV